jgi:hypothetical protein
MKRKLSVIAAAALATGLLAAGCGDDDDESSDLSHDEFVTQANQICSEGNAQIEQDGSDVKGGPGTPEFEAFVADTLVPNVQGQIQDIRDLGIPEEDDSLNETLDEAELITQDLAEDPASLTEGDPFAPINQELTDAGLTECAS